MRFSQPKLESMQDSSQEDEREARAAEWDLIMLPWMATLVVWLMVQVWR